MGGPAPLAKGSGAALLALLLALLLPAGALGFGPLSSFGTFGDGPGELNEPAGVAVGGDGTAYVADRGNDRVSVFAPDGKFSREIGVGLIDQPRGVALGPGGHLYVADTGNQRVAVFAPGGEFLFAFDAADAMVEPVGLAFGPEGLLFVVDRGAHLVAAFSAVGELVHAFGEEGSGDGQLLGPTGVAVAPDGSVAVADGGNDRVAIFSVEGEFLRAFAVATPGSIAIDAAGVVYVGESSNFRVSRFDLDGELRDSFGEGTGIAPGAVNDPTGIAFDCRGAVYVAEQGPGLARVERFGEPGTARCSASVPREPVRPLVQPHVPPPAALPESKFQFGKLVLNRKRGTGTLFVFVPGPGGLTLGGAELRTTQRRASRSGGLVKMPVTPIGELKSKLRKKGRAKVKLRVSFKPTGGVSRTKRKPILLLKRR